MKKAFSLLEIIIGILIIGLISSFAIPKLMDTKDFASATTLKRDIFSIVSSAQTYNLTAPETFSIEDAINVNDKIWTITDGVLSDNTECVEISFDTNLITVSKNDTDTDICNKLFEEFTENQTYDM